MRLVTFVTGLVGALATLSCVEDRTTSPTSKPPSSTTVRTVAGIEMTEGEARSRLASITRLVAVALQDSSVRGYVYSQLHGSPVREHKLYFRPFVLKPGNPLLARMASLRSVSQEAIGTLVDSLIDPEFYMPVKDHWARWAGGANLIVATALRDHEIPTAYDLTGSTFPLSSAVTPPTIPTLAIVPIETDFTAQPPAAQCVDCDPGGGGTPPPPGLNMTFSYIGGDWEGFLMGDPEFEVHVLTVSPNSSGTYDYRCAGEHAPYVSSLYDQNGSIWTGNVELLSNEQLNSFADQGKHTIVQVWEDDNQACVIHQDRNWVVAAVATLTSFVAVSLDYSIAKNGWWSTCSNGGDQICWASVTIFLLSPWVINDALQRDDYVGTLVPTSVVGVSFSDANYAIMDEHAVIRGRTMLTHVPYVPPPSGVTLLHVDMMGPTTLAPNTTCTWWASVTGASGSVTYQWYRDYSPVATSATYTGSSGSGFTLTVYVTSGSQAATDAANVVASGSNTCSP